MTAQNGSCGAFGKQADQLHLKITRAWAMPSRETFTIKPIRELLKEELTGGLWIDPFAGKNSPAKITNDLNPEFRTDCHEDAIEFLKRFKNKSISGVLFDPPYSPRQIAECYKSVGMDTQKGKLTRADFYTRLKKETARIAKKGAKVICCGWNSGGIGKTNGFKMTRILLVAHGGHHNDTIVTVEIKQ